MATVWAISLLHQILRALGYSVAYMTGLADRAQSAFKVKRSVACIRWLAVAADPNHRIAYQQVMLCAWSRD